jgi:hypothetical protein
VTKDYEEAASIFDRSPRGAAALLRMALERFCMGLKPRAGNLNEAIGQLVADGLRVEVQQALDAVRVIGNEAVHPGQLDLQDDRGTAEMMFRLLNIIADRMIADVRTAEEAYAMLPKAKRDAVTTRDQPPKQ